MAGRAASKADVKSGTAADAWSAAIEFDFPTLWISMECWTESLDIALSYDGSTFQDTIEIDPDRPLLLPFQAVSFRVKNAEAGKNSRYQVIGTD